MLKCPDNTTGQLNVPKVYAFRNMFNNALESIPAQHLQGKFQHLILSIDVGDDFDNFGSLTNARKDHF